jgi:hypothetical protein
MLNVVQKNHIATGHGGRDKMIKEANKKYANVSIEALVKYLELQKRRKISKICIATSVVLFDFNGHRTTNFVQI